MPTIVSLKTTQLQNQFQAFMTASNLGGLETAVANRLNSPAVNMNVNNVTAEIVAGGTAVRFTINPDGLNPNKIKAALV